MTCWRKEDTGIAYVCVHCTSDGLGDNYTQFFLQINPDCSLICTIGVWKSTVVKVKCRRSAGLLGPVLWMRQCYGVGWHFLETQDTYNLERRQHLGTTLHEQGSKVNSFTIPAKSRWRHNFSAWQRQVPLCQTFIRLSSRKRLRCTTLTGVFNRSQISWSVEGTRSDVTSTTTDVISSNVMNRSKHFKWSGILSQQLLIRSMRPGRHRW